MRSATKKGLGCAVIFAAIGVYLVIFQLPYLFDPGLRDIPIRKNLADLTAQECAEICRDCESLYSKMKPELADQEYLRLSRGSVPDSVRSLGYRSGTLTAHQIEFRAGAGGFSQVGPILLTCHFDPESGQPTRLRVDWGSYDPATGLLERPG